MKTTTWILITIILTLITVNSALANSLSVSSTRWNLEGCACQPLDFNIIISNPSFDLHKYYLTIDNYEEYTIYSENPVLIAPLAQKEIGIFLKLPCNIYNQQNLSLKITADDGYKAFLPLIANIKECFTTEFNIEKQKEYCNLDANTATLKIKNLNYSAENFKFKTNLNSEYNEVSLAGYTNASIKYNITLAKNANLTNYEILAESQYTNKIYKIPFNITSKNCYNLKTNLTKESAICGLDIHSYDLKVKNTGTKTDTFNITLDAPKFVTISNKQVTLEPQEEQIIRLKAEPEKTTNANYKIKVNIQSLKHQEISNTEILNLNVINKEKCYQINFEPKTIKSNSTETKHEIEITNNGLRDATYKLLLQGPDFIKLKTTEVQLNKGETKKIKLEATGNKTGSWKLNLIANTEGINYPQKIYFKEYNENSFLRAYKKEIMIWAGAILAFIGTIYLIIKYLGRRIKILLLKLWYKIKSILANRTLWKIIAITLLIAIAILSMYAVYLSQNTNIGINNTINTINQTNSTILPTTLPTYVATYWPYFITGVVILAIIILILERKSISNIFK